VQGKQKRHIFALTHEILKKAGRKNQNYEKKILTWGRKSDIIYSCQADA
jgi:hypothetical protein